MYPYCPMNLLRLPCLLLVLFAMHAAPLSAKAQTDGSAAEAVEPDPKADYTYHEIGWAGCSLLLPPGGSYPTPEDLGIDSSVDPMAYPVIWDSEGATDYSRMMFGVYTAAEEFTGATFDELTASYHSTLMASYPQVIAGVENVEFPSGTWKRLVLANSETGVRCSVYSIYYGSMFYTLAFASPLYSNSDNERLAQEETMGDFAWVFYEEEDYLWFF